MRAFQVTSIGASPHLRDVPDPVPGPGEALVAMRAAGLNFADLLMTRGQYQDTPPPPFTLGMELCGTVLALGPETEGPAPGTRVAVFAGQGGLADRGVFPVARLLPVPDAMSDAEAAGFQIAFGTAHLALSRRARLRPGETLVVTGAGGGVGLTAVEVGAAMGARVIAIARGEEKRAAARAAGAAHAIDAGADLTAEIRALGGADVVYDAVGGPSFAALLGATNREGRILVIGFASGEVPPVPANILLVKNIDVMGFYWGGYLRFAPQALTDSLATLMDWHVRGLIRTPVGATFPLDRADEALALLADRRAVGKVIVTP
jgi:NADPH2:quinone reductase